MEEQAFAKKYEKLVEKYPFLNECKETLRGIVHETCGELIAVSAECGMPRYVMTMIERVRGKFKADLVVFCPRCSTDTTLEVATHTGKRHAKGSNAVLTVTVVRHQHHDRWQLARGNGHTDELVLHCPTCDTKPTWVGWPIYY